MCDSVTNEDQEQYIRERLEEGKSPSKKHAVILVGGPGAGKSGIKKPIIEKQLKLKESDFINIDPDRILSELFDNNNDCRRSVNQINDIIYEKSIKQGKNIIFDGTGKDYDWYFNDVIQILKREEYIVTIGIISNNVNIVLDRIKKRAEETGRDVHKDYVEYVYDKLEQNIPKYLNISCVYADNIFLFDNKYKLKHTYSKICEKGVESKMVTLQYLLSRYPTISAAIVDRLGGIKKKKISRKNKKKRKRTKKKKKKSKKKSKKK